jgi:putative cardiolipin synthase
MNTRPHTRGSLNAAAWQMGFLCLRWMGACVMVLWLTACGVLPVQAVRDDPLPPPIRSGGPLDRLVATGVPPLGSPVGASAYVLVDDGLDALAVRVALIRAAQRSIDWQSYIWANDTTGLLLMRELLRAADRGVSVRLLLDDNNTVGLDPLLSLLDAHPSLAVRLFNPFPSRAMRALDWMSNFGRLNRRMHNKLLVADGQVALLGGRNVGDVYFRASEEVHFDDTDLLLIGPVLVDAQASFERYWDSPWSYALHGLVAPVSDTRQALDERVRAALSQPSAGPWRTELRESPVVRALFQPQGMWTWAPMAMFDDPPHKVVPDATSAGAGSGGLFAHLEARFGQARHSLDLVSAYFVPGDDGAQALASLARQGVKVRVLTNSLATNDVAAAHVGYARQRHTLLESGVTLLELRPDAAVSARAGQRTRLVASRVSLHAKVFVVDDEDVFIGSLNLDPRSSRLNTEVGVVVQSPALAAQLRERLDQDVGDAWQLGLDSNGLYHAVVSAVSTHAEEGDLRSAAQVSRPQTADVAENGTTTATAVAPVSVYAQAQRLRGEPQAGVGRRVLVWLLSWFDLDWLL